MLSVVGARGRGLVWKEGLRCLILCLYGTLSNHTEASDVLLYHGPTAAPDLSRQSIPASRSRFRFGRNSFHPRTGTDSHGGRGHLEEHRLHSLVDDLGVSLADAQSRPIVPRRGEADRRVVDFPG